MSGQECHLCHLFGRQKISAAVTHRTRWHPGMEDAIDLGRSVVPGGQFGDRAARLSTSTLERSTSIGGSTRWTQNLGKDPSTAEQNASRATSYCSVELTAEACALSRFGASRSASGQSPRSIRRNALAVGAPSFRRDTHPPWSALRSTDIVAEVELDLDDPLFGDPPPKG